ncbi:MULTISPECIES: universal stress protein [unclassified Streptomyces]|uniref:universal stress protein n=1 Tax=unclassified Streptomyces TaxID=2593676 RepID=UPI00236529FB|nr:MULTISPECIES: universal stress protein [unclassified Streptomyces]MDF3144914.1 universal stress protein [Streptomyces sp. T21Q-yed]WDF43962.1 universal stress protein [Streptomyces sp. T12]
MVRTVVAGFDGSSESRAAAEWAAREAKLRGLPLKIVHVWEPVPGPMAQAPLLGAETQQHWSERSEMGVPPAEGWGRVPREAAEGIRLRHPGVEVTTEHLTGGSADTLVKAAADAELLVLGSRGLSGFGGFMVGSVGLSVVAHAERPVVLVRAGEQAADEHEPDPVGIPSAATPYRPVLLGLDAASPADSVIEFAFEEAARRKTGLRVIHGWNLPPYYVYGLSADAQLHDEIARQQSAVLAEALRPWRQKYPSVEVTEETPSGSPGIRLVDASREASLVVVGRRVRRSPFGAHIGPVAHAVLHHATAPVAVVAHD